MRISSQGASGVAGIVAIVALSMALVQRPSVAQAQQAPPAQTPATLPEVVVTAPAKKKVAPPKKAQPAPVPAPPPEWTTDVRMAPTGGSEVPIGKVPAGVTIVGKEELDRARTSSFTEVLNAYVPGVTINEALGNPLATDLQYRGFSASPLNGTPQGLAIYQNGVRLNEVFGDSMNFDLIPQIAIANVAIMSNNPIYGLNALGGAANVVMKDGFMFRGATVDTRLGSFGHKEVAAEAGQKAGNWAVYIAGEWIDEDGWRDISPARAKRAYADIGVKGASGAELHLNYTFANSHLGVVGPTPVELVDERRATVFTSPQSFDNEMHALNLTGTLPITSTFKLTGNAYYRSFKQKRPDGNVSEAVACDPGEVAPDAFSGPLGYLCFEEDDDPLFGKGGIAHPVTGKVAIKDLPNGAATVLGGNDSIAVASFSFGGTLQGVSTARLLGLPNQLILGASFDHGKARVKSQSELGVLDPTTLVVTGLGTIIDQSGFADPDDVEVTPVDLIARTRYYGVYFLNTLDVTDKLAVTAGGRFNIANIVLQDQLGDALNGDHTFQRFNPMIGATYKLAPGLTLYSGYSESNRAPTPAELGCADPQRPCLLENFLVSDPPLKQVVGRTVEAGVRGEIKVGYAGRDAMGAPRANTIGWSLGYFRTLLTDDIMTVASEVQGRGYFLNAGETLREGVEAAVNYRSSKLIAYASYAYVNATFRDALELASPDSPVGAPCSGDADATCAHVQPGDTIPTIPRHRLKVGFDYWLSPQWRIGADLIAVSSQFLRGDEGNDDRQLAGYAVVNLRTAYKVTDNVEVYGIVKNVFNRDFANFGTYYDTEALHTVGGAGIPAVPVGAGPNGTILGDPRMITPSAPLALYGGLRIRF
jgi:outer membrane receptor protein involved in Fe transport